MLSVISNNSMALMNAAMCTDVVCLLSAKLQAMIRMSGKVGARAFQECVARGMVAMYAQAYTHDVTTPTVADGGEAKEEDDFWSSGASALEIIPISSTSSRRSFIPIRRLVMNHSFLDRQEDRGYSLQFPGSNTIEIIACNSFQFIDHVSRGDRKSITAHIYNLDQSGYNFMASRCRLQSFNLLEWDPDAAGVIVDEEGNTLITLSLLQKQQHQRIQPYRSQYAPIPLSTLNTKTTRTLTRILTGFLKYSKVEHVNIAALRHVLRIEHEFMRGTNLASIDLSPLGALTSIGNHFMSDSPLLKEVDLMSFRHVVEVGTHFLATCEMLEKVDMKSMVALKSVGVMMMSKCPSLSRLNLPHRAPLDDPRNAALQHKFMPDKSSATPLYINDLLMVVSDQRTDEGEIDDDGEDVWGLLGS